MVYYGVTRGVLRGDPWCIMGWAVTYFFKKQPKSNRDFQLFKRTPLRHYLTPPAPLYQPLLRPTESEQPFHARCMYFMRCDVDVLEDLGTWTRPLGAQFARLEAIGVRGQGCRRPGSFLLAG